MDFIITLIFRIYTINISLNIIIINKMLNDNLSILEKKIKIKCNTKVDRYHLNDHLV